MKFLRVIDEKGKSAHIRTLRIASIETLDSDCSCDKSLVTLIGGDCFRSLQPVEELLKQLQTRSTRTDETATVD